MNWPRHTPSSWEESFSNSRKENKLLQKLIVDPDAKRRQLNPNPPPQYEDPQTTYLKENQQSEISPNHWGSDGNESVDGYDPYPQDPPPYNPGDHHVKKSAREVAYQGRKFFNYDLLFLEPRYTQSSAMQLNSGAAISNVPADFEFDLVNRIGFGFESKSGPGFEMNYFELDQASGISRVSSAGTGLQSNIFLTPSNQTFGLSSSGANQTLAVTQSTDLQYLDAAVFKYIKFPIAKLAGHIGIRYAEIDHEHHATLSNAGGGLLGRLDHETDFKGFGPRIGVSYVRPIGHTRFRLIGSFYGSILAGDREQKVESTANGLFLDRSNEHFVTSTEMALTLEWQYRFSDSTSFVSRLGYESQKWFRAGTPTNPQGDSGLSGLAFGLGLNW